MALNLCGGPSVSLEGLHAMGLWYGDSRGKGEGR